MIKLETFACPNEAVPEALNLLHLLHPDAQIYTKTEGSIEDGQGGFINLDAGNVTGILVRHPNL